MTGEARPPATDPVRAAYIEALARRAAAHSGPLRVLLDRKLAAARAELAVTASPASPVAAAPGGAAPPVPTLRPGPLAELTARLYRVSLPAATTARRGTGDAANTPPAPPPELRSLQRDRAAWVRLSADHELQRAMAQVPENPGPLNPQLLVLRSLRLMQRVSPAYLARFVAQVETLVWLEQASAMGLPLPPASKAAAVRREPEVRRKRSRGGRAAADTGAG